jgi:hypothetical protein
MQTTITTRKTLESFKAGINVWTLSQTLQDAIQITRRLGLKYIWIDALCIVQQEENHETLRLNR